MTDIIIIGSGPAGLSSALYALRYGCTVTVFEQLAHGGQLVTTPEVENYPAFQSITGFDLAIQMYNQVKSLGAVFVSEAVTDLNTADLTVKTKKNTYSAKAVIIASGAKRRLLECEGEDRLKGIGVSYCATCDGAFFRGKEVVIVGGGNTALEDALFLSRTSSKVYLVHRRNEFRGMKTLVDSVLKSSNIEVIYNSHVLSINGANAVESISINQNGVDSIISVSGVFVAVGTVPNTGFLNEQSGINCDSSGYIVAGEDCCTAVNGIYVAGDCRTKQLRQIVTAVADGAVAAFMAVSHFDGI